MTSDLNDTSTNPGEVGASAQFDAGSTGPFVQQTLVAEPASTFDASLKKAKDEIATCRNLKISADGITLSFDVTPFNFAQGATGAVLDGTYQGVELNGYLSVARVSNRNIALLFLYFQIGSSSSQNASRIYMLAETKAAQTFPPL